MAGWLIQGVRGEGKSLCAVYLARKYLTEGRVVATNLDLFMDELVDQENTTISYRLPDKPRIEDFELIGSAYDPKYKGEDKNGLLILDELGTWLNSRSWKDKGRGDVLNWLFLSRKLHWDIVLLAQDHEMIDKQAKSTLCDYLVQASRTDREKVPYFSKFYEFFGFNSYRSLKHVYHVFYGFHIQGNKPQDVWEFDGKSLYDGYDTNQFFTDGEEVFEINGKAVISDQRATFTNLPASYLSGFHQMAQYLSPLESLQKIYKYRKKEKTKMALRKQGEGLNKPKLIMLSMAALAFVGYRLYHGFSLPSSSSSPSTISTPLTLPPVSQTSPSIPSYSPSPAPVPSALPASAPNPSRSFSSSAPISSVKLSQLQNTGYKNLFIKTLFDTYKPRVGSLSYTKSSGALGYISFYDGAFMVERFSFTQLKSFGLSIVVKSYGVDVLTDYGVMIVTRWNLPIVDESQYLTNASIS